MAYRIDLNEPLDNTLKRIAVEQIDRAIRDLEAKKTPSLGVHEARKTFKKMRALLRLIRPALTSKAYRRENIRFRDLGRTLSGTRDIQSMIETALKLKVHPEFNNTQDIIQAILALLQTEKSRAEENLHTLTDKSIISDLEKSKKSVMKLDLSHVSEHTILKGYTLWYTRARKMMVKACRQTEAEPFHDWRKTVQYHTRHTQLLIPLWPDYMRLRLNAARELGLILGDHNDLSIVLNYVIKNSSLLGHDNSIHQFIDLCEKREKDLQELAKPRGRRLFALSSKMIEHQFKTFWETTNALEPIEDTLNPSCHMASHEQER